MSAKTETVTSAQIKRATALVANGRFRNVEEVSEAGLDYVEGMESPSLDFGPVAKRLAVGKAQAERREYLEGTGEEAMLRIIRAAIARP